MNATAKVSLVAPEIFDKLLESVPPFHWNVGVIPCGSLDLVAADNVTVLALPPSFIKEADVFGVTSITGVNTAVQLLCVDENTGEASKSVPV